MINSIEIVNFKSFQKSDTSLPPFGAIVGKNAVGKSNLIQALSLVKSLVSGDSLPKAAAKMSLTQNELFNASDVSSEFSIKIDLSNGSKYLLEFSVELLSANQSTVIRSEKLEKIIDGKANPIYTRKQNSLTDFAGNPVPLAIDNERLATALFNQDDASGIRKIFSDVYITKEYFEVGESIGSVGSSEESLASLLVWLNHKPDLYQTFIDISKKMIPSISAFKEVELKASGNPAEQQYLVLMQEHNLKRMLSMKLLSAGDLRTLYLIGEAIKLNEHSSLIIEEIENGIHPHRINELIDHLRKIATIKNMQILFTTHSPLVINRLPVQEVVLAEKNDKGTELTLLSESDQAASIQKMLERGGKMTDYINNL